VLENDDKPATIRLKITDIGPDLMQLFKNGFLETYYNEEFTVYISNSNCAPIVVVKVRIMGRLLLLRRK